MATDDKPGVTIPPSPFPDPLVYFWLALLEGIVTFGLVLFSIGLLEGGEVIPDVFPEWEVSIAALGVIVLVMFGYRLYKGGYVGG